MLGRRSYLESIGTRTCPIGVRLLLVSLLVIAMRSAAKLYIVQELLVVPLLVGVLITTIFLIAIAFILFQEGIRRTATWAKIGLMRLANLGLQEPMRPLAITTQAAQTCPRSGATKHGPLKERGLDEC